MKKIGCFAVHKVTSKKFNTPLPVRPQRPAGDRPLLAAPGPDGVRAQRPVVGINKPELRIRRDLAEVMDLAGRANDAALQTIRATDAVRDSRSGTCATAWS
jgi:hypothetical protein